ncbi:MAG: roadblock/LC7 domain-containing protein [Actinobacteria bacterium]|nr:roadblock/LC7 domain-containing protein [Actinomycetota bacterium]
MNERDFAELISVFLKGNEPDKNSNHKEKEESDTVVDIGLSSNEAEVRKNIIEALAERMKESREIEGNLIKPAEEDGGFATEETLVGQDAGEKVLAVEDTESGAFKAREPAKTVKEGPLITKEEVDRLLSKEEPADIVTLQQILHQFTSLDGVIAALLVTRDGFIVDYASTTKFDLDMVSAVIATGFGTLDKIGRELEQGDLQLAMLEYEQGPIVVAPLIQDIALVVVASQWTTLGRIRWEIKKRSNELIANL